MDSQKIDNYQPDDGLSEDDMTSTPRGRDSSKSESDMARETLSRVRRIETRLTSALIALGVRTDAQKPEFTPAKGSKLAQIHAPSRHSSLSELIASTPKDFAGSVEILVGSDCVATLTVAATS